MFLNNDLLLVVGSIIVGGVFTYTFYNNIFSTYNSESLVNTTSSLDSIGPQATELSESTYTSIQPNNALAIHQMEANVQTHNLHVDVGVQTESASLWSMFKNWLRKVFSVNSSDV
jgi:hypothetical protein